ncbi:hypothetical protein M0811_01481 [Anaeramoeba ignava]|uniref:Uncharacterized protein n=1 Tax=Anaeramoeba ignava TaxID=1746090 RepID=A0A9Q0LGW2_ANAIG|nr:hypothetical protein M0811_01481 [Anaeramoeba ignava]
MKYFSIQNDNQKEEKTQLNSSLLLNFLMKTKNGKINKFDKYIDLNAIVIEGPLIIKPNDIENEINQILKSKSDFEEIKFQIMNLSDNIDIICVINVDKPFFLKEKEQNILKVEKLQTKYLEIGMKKENEKQFKQKRKFSIFTSFGQYYNYFYNY